MIARIPSGSNAMASMCGPAPLRGYGRLRTYAVFVCLCCTFLQTVRENTLNNPACPETGRERTPARGGLAADRRPFRRVELAFSSLPPSSCDPTCPSVSLVRVCPLCVRAPLFFLAVGGYIPNPSGAGPFGAGNRNVTTDAAGSVWSFPDPANAGEGPTGV